MQTYFSPVKYMGLVLKPIHRVFLNHLFVQDYKPFRSTVLPVYSVHVSISQCIVQCINLFLLLCLMLVLS